MRFLIVDDDDISGELLQAILSPYADCHLAGDGRAAIDAFRLALETGQRYDLVCLDIMMPGADGHDVLDAIRQMERRQGIFGSDGTKVMMTTALVDSKQCIRAFQEGCESYCTKPLDGQKLLDEIQTLLGELHPRPEEGSTPRSDSDLPAEQATAPSTKIRCLIVDDDGVCRALLNAFLSPYADCHFAYNGQEAVDAVRIAMEDGNPYDLITMDIMMPGINGHDALRAIRATEEDYAIYGLDGVKIVMTTALRDSKHCIQSFREGCEAYVTKPLIEGELFNKLHELGLLKTPANNAPASRRC